MNEIWEDESKRYLRIALSSAINAPSHDFSADIPHLLVRGDIIDVLTYVEEIQINLTGKIDEGNLHMVELKDQVDMDQLFLEARSREQELGGTMLYIARMQRRTSMPYKVAIVDSSSFSTINGLEAMVRQGRVPGFFLVIAETTPVSDVVVANCSEVRLFGDGTASYRGKDSIDVEIVSGPPLSGSGVQSMSTFTRIDMDERVLFNW